MLEWSYIDEHPSEKQTGYFKASLNELKKFNFKIKKCDDPYTGKMYIKRNFWGGVDLFMEYRSSNICEITLDHGPEFTTYHQINEEKLQNFEFELESK